MASHALTARFRRPMMAWSGLFKTELLTLSKSWVLRGWIIALALTEFFLLTGLLVQGRVQSVPASAVVAAVLNGFLFIWSLVIIVLGAGAISTESEVIADSILSRSCTRTQYIAAKLTARALAILAVYLVAALAAGLCAWRYAANDMTLSTMAVGIGIVGLAVLLLLSIGIALSVIANNTVVSIVSALLLWYVAAPIFSFLGAEYLSPASLTRNLPRILKDSTALQLVQATAAPSSLTLVFSKPLDSARAEDPQSYLVEAEGQPMPVSAAVYDRSRSTVVLQGLSLPQGGSVSVTTRNLGDSGGGEISPAGDSLTIAVPTDRADRADRADRPDRADTAEGEMTPSRKEAAEPVNAPPVTAAPSRAAASRSARSSDRVPPRVESCTATGSSLTVRFSEVLEPKRAEEIENYFVESPPGTRQSVRTVTYNATTRTSLLSGLSLASGDPVKVTVLNIRDLDGNLIDRKANTATFSEVTTWKYLLGFGLPTLAAFLLAIVWFARRDL